MRSHRLWSSAVSSSVESSTCKDRKANHATAPWRTALLIDSKDAISRWTVANSGKQFTVSLGKGWTLNVIVAAAQSITGLNFYKNDMPSTRSYDRLSTMRAVMERGKWSATVMRIVHVCKLVMVVPSASLTDISGAFSHDKSVAILEFTKQCVAPLSIMASTWIAYCFADLTCNLCGTGC